MAPNLNFNGEKLITGDRMKRNKRTEKLCHHDLTPLTERILALMGPEGKEIRRRLRLFYQSRRHPDEAGRSESLPEEMT